MGSVTITIDIIAYLVLPSSQSFCKSNTMYISSLEATRHAQEYSTHRHDGLVTGLPSLTDFQ